MMRVRYDIIFCRFPFVPCNVLLTSLQYCLELFVFCFEWLIIQASVNMYVPSKDCLSSSDEFEIAEAREVGFSHLPLQWDFILYHSV
jgi:hypothetical protein